MTNKFTYNVAFSFLQKDEILVFQANDLIQDRFKTFVYPHHQRELAGADGEKVFNETFGEKARLVVVFYRENWGKTPWTRIEETAIRNRAHDEGYDFVMFVKLDSSTMPKWLPKNRIYVDFERWGLKGLASVIEARIQEAGGQIHIESLEDQTARIKRTHLLQDERRKYLISNESYQDSQKEFDKLYTLIENKTKFLEDSEMRLHFNYLKKPGSYISVKFDKYNLHLVWDYSYSNSLKDSLFAVALTMNTNKRDKFGRPEEYNLSRKEYNFDINPIDKQIGWSEKNGDNEFVTSEQLMLYWLGLFLDRVRTAKEEEHKQSPF